ncbi:hypothetical protein J2W91_004573 [Paenibacillus amylolyticus]|uniref:Uncharacterized protein n=1 Tax=Paenibacillus amylolyticus TaxID=1451 RepID=A0AAP5LNT5_PAEAM|nr:hypothetical protein [Paenibacillus amylolyticus]
MFLFYYIVTSYFLPVKSYKPPFFFTYIYEKEVKKWKFIELVPSFGFPVVITFMLLKYLMDNIKEKFDTLDRTLKELIDLIKDKKTLP